MKILIVDDDEQRSQRLKEYLAKACSIHQDEIVLVACLADARGVLRVAYFDALVLDVVLPKRKDKKDPHHSVGIGLLQELNRPTSLKKPEKIIGITAHLSDASAFKSEFEQSCNIVVEAPNNSDVWKAKIASSLLYTGVSKTSRAMHLSRTAVVSVHGIRTFGQWQARLRRLIEIRAEGVSFHTYKFGYFSSIVFLFPFLRSIQVKRLERKLAPVLQEESLDRIFIFCHSFGSYLVAYALKSILKKGRPGATLTLVMCGSVLSSTFDWQSINNGNSLRIVNECGSRDLVLWMSAALVYGVGMAGKIGFYGFSNGFLTNRFFVGGHSLYFVDDEFMLKHWLPLLDESPILPEIDERVNSNLFMRAGDNIVTAIELCKSWIYLSAALLVAYYISVVI